MVVTDEISRRDNAAPDNRATEAGLGPSMRLELWDKGAKVSFDKKVLVELVSLRFLETHRHVCILGPVGVGKTFVPRERTWPHRLCHRREALQDCELHEVMLHWTDLVEELQRVERIAEGYAAEADPGRGRWRSSSTPSRSRTTRTRRSSR
jgi:hypothetical protein